METLQYLNNSGSRWVIRKEGKKIQHLFKTKSGKSVLRTINYCEAFGNFTSVNISYKSKRITVLTDTLLED